MGTQLLEIWAVVEKRSIPINTLEWSYHTSFWELLKIKTHFPIHRRPIRGQIHMIFIAKTFPAESPFISVNCFSRRSHFSKIFSRQFPHFHITWHHKCLIGATSNKSPSHFTTFSHDFPLKIIEYWGEHFSAATSINKYFVFSKNFRVLLG